jgi:hypothetical protein
MLTLTSRAFLVLTLTAALFGSACDIKVDDNGISVDVGQGSVTDEWRRTYTLPEGGRLEITNQNGAIDVERGSGREVQVVVERSVRGSDADAKAVLASLQMDEEVTPASVKIGLHPSEESEARPRSRRGVTLRYRVKVPDGLTVVLGTANGGLHLEDVTGQFETATTNGGITAVDITGAIKATSVNGGIRIEMESVTGDVQAAVTNGGIRLELPVATRGTVDASCVNGGVSVDDDLGLQATEKSRLRVAGTLNGGGPKIVATTVNGGIRLDAVTPGD